MEGEKGGRGWGRDGKEGRHEREKKTGGKKGDVLVGEGLPMHLSDFGS